MTTLSNKSNGIKKDKTVLQKASIVISKLGHDSGDVFLVVGFDSGRVLISDGDKRKLVNPKSKNPAHLLYRGVVSQALAAALENGTANDSEIRKVLSEYCKAEAEGAPAEIRSESL